MLVEWVEKTSQSLSSLGPRPPSAVLKRPKFHEKCTTPIALAATHTHNPAHAVGNRALLGRISSIPGQYLSKYPLPICQAPTPLHPLPSPPSSRSLRLPIVEVPRLLPSTSRGFPPASSSHRPWMAPHIRRRRAPPSPHTRTRMYGRASISSESSAH